MTRTVLLLLVSTGCAVAPPRSFPDAWTERVLAEDGGLAEFVGAGAPGWTDLDPFLVALWERAHASGSAAQMRRAMHAMTAFPAAARHARARMLATMAAWWHLDEGTLLGDAGRCLDLAASVMDDDELERACAACEELVLEYDGTPGSEECARSMYALHLEQRRRAGASTDALLREYLASDAPVLIAAAGRRLLLEPERAGLLVELAAEWERDPTVPAQFAHELAQVDFVGPEVLTYGSPWCMRASLVRQWHPEVPFAQFGQPAAIRSEPLRPRLQ